VAIRLLQRITNTCSRRIAQRHRNNLLCLWYDTTSALVFSYEWKHFKQQLRPRRLLVGCTLCETLLYITVTNLGWSNLHLMYQYDSADHVHWQSGVASDCVGPKTRDSSGPGYAGTARSPHHYACPVPRESARATTNRQMQFDELICTSVH